MSLFDADMSQTDSRLIDVFFLNHIDTRFRIGDLIGDHGEIQVLIGPTGEHIVEPGQDVLGLEITGYGEL